MRSHWVPSRRRLVLPFLVGAAFLFACYLELVPGVGWEQRTEIALPTLQRRTSTRFVAWYVPLSHWQHETEPPVLVEHLRRRGVLPPPDTEPQRWFTVRASHPAMVCAGVWSEGNALERALNHWGDGPRAWVAWSEEHPELARVLWPQVVRWSKQADRTACGKIAALLYFVGLGEGTTPDAIRRRIDELNRQID